MSDPHDLQRFVAAQAPVFERVLDELRRGRKASHWMWFVFPQIQGLGRSPTARRYAIASLEEARAYLEHPVLGPRLRQCAGLVNAVQGASIHDILGDPDDLKFHSCMTLFARAAPGERVFQDALDRYFAGEPDRVTLERL
ncbi:MAG: DUF1810 domain-containing protein [Caulobacteraceae bacterium]|nr:DUF1810 domain-containing protein [Caulobacteraceae bacterium]